MRSKVKFKFLFMILAVSLAAQSIPPDSTGAPVHPLDLYLDEIDEMGRTLSNWEGDSLDQGSWFFGSYAMLLLSNNGKGENVPYAGLEAAIPALWSDFKYLTPRYLIELAGGTLSNGNLMSIRKDLVFSKLRTEERFILAVAGFGYLRMLQGTVGDSLFTILINDAMELSAGPSGITDELIKSMSIHCCDDLAYQFEKALISSRWSDVNLNYVRTRQDSIEIGIEHLGVWHFPVQVLVISTDGDSAQYTYALNQTGPLTIPKIDVAEVVLDADHLLAEYYRYNNRWPRLRNNIHIQPFGALPDWTNYRVTINPSIWSDWDGEKRIGLKLTSGFGVDLWPAYPSDYRHRTSVEFNGHTPYDSSMSWGGRMSYSHPINLDKRLFSHLRAHTYDDWSGISIGLTRYVGKQTFLIQGPRLIYQRVGLAFEYDQYGDSLIWDQNQDIHIVKGAYSGLSLTKQGDRVYIRVKLASGEGPQGNFSIFKAQTDLSGVFWGWVVGGVQFETGFQSESTPDPYQFTHQYAWQDGLAAIPTFRGQTKLTENTNEYMGLSISGGYWMSGIQIKVFTSSLIIDMDEVGWGGVKPHYAAGFGFEHKSFFTAGLYFPIWQSHPLEGEEPWAWRYQARLVWNL
ncbi:MAG: hypothetical protein HN995_02060 [Candidatus Marinimicrobia bacterium]|jgi:hypothetical protein|nr:hypothetical protein [Candidatus Neomarinimicrobiota bacterium]MBT3576505.1 hypothetical protein [Candidatus Neomarinimicrobiota bacterium]MBT3681291.1 hypothetical protein [Candidatus Neomarinimicrobiota bacterium]MBT3951505.1 hypothetical protein [Candidatus Neomarinimicrobiota bacterium]MBT4253897.1 hypothetical protein [Candidatus Neomarinimicrobiota bacterium]